MDTSVIMVALGGAILIALFQAKQKRDFFAFMDQYKAQHGVEIQTTGRPGIDWSSLLVALILLLALGVYTFLQKDSATSPQTFLLMAVVLAIIFGSSALTSGMTAQIFYTSEGFFLKNRFVSFKEIKAFEQSQKGNILRLKDDSTHILTPQQLVGLDILHKKGFYTMGE